MRAKMPERLFYEWMAYDRIDPFQRWRDDFRMAQLLAMFANAHKGRGMPLRRPIDFMTEYGRREGEAMSDDEIEAELERVLSDRPGVTRANQE